MHSPDTLYIVMAIAFIGLIQALLYAMKAYKLMIVCGVLMVSTEITVALLGYESKWYVLSALAFYLMALIYIILRINKILKRFEDKER